MGVEASTSRRGGASIEAGQYDHVRVALQWIPRPLRFLVVGGLGLITDLGTFTLIFNALGVHPLIARVFSLAVATLVTWRLNRAVTFDHSGRRPGREAIRYTLVTLAAQGTSYAIFAGLTLTVLAALPQAAIIVGAAAATLISYNGHRLFSFAPTSAPAANP